MSPTPSSFSGQGAGQPPALPGYAARGVLGMIRLYQKLLSPVLPAVFGSACGCRFSPTCSHYAAEAVRTHGVLAGIRLAFCRLLKCTPLHPGGFDPVPQSRAPQCRRADSSSLPQPVNAR